MLIIFTSPKGGTGKITLTLLYANYLFQVFKKNVCILDLDKNHVLSQKVKRHPDFANKEHIFPVLRSNYEDIYQAKQSIKDHTFEVMLVDLHFEITEQYFQILQAAELIVCPYQSDELTMDSTLTFAMLLTSKKSYSRTSKLFLANTGKSRLPFSTHKYSSGSILQ